MTGTVYAPAAQLAESGNAQLNAAIIVDTMTISGNGVANRDLERPSGTVAYTPAQIRAAYGISDITATMAPARPSPSSTPTMTRRSTQALDAFDTQFGLTRLGRPCTSSTARHRRS